MSEARDQLIRGSILTVTAVILLSRGLDAQAPYSALSEAHQKSWIVRIAASDITLPGGRVRYVDSTLVMIGSFQLPLRNVTAVDRRVREGGAAVPSAVGAGLVLGTVAFFAVDPLCLGNCSIAQQGLGFALGAAIGATVGALIGYVVDPGTIRWIRIWPE